MEEKAIMGEVLCPWCNNALPIIKSPKTGYHYANCTGCNAHFRNIPITLIKLQEVEHGRAEDNRGIKEARGEDSQPGGEATELDGILSKIIGD